MKQERASGEINAPKSSKDSEPKKIYHRPVLRTFGALHRMTQGSAGTKGDGGGTKRK